MKADYDLFQEKFDKHAKASNNLNQDLKDEIEELNARLSKLQIYYDDQEEIKATEKAKAKKEKEEAFAAKDLEVEEMRKDRDKYKQDLENFKNEFNMKMT